MNYPYPDCQQPLTYTDQGCDCPGCHRHFIPCARCPDGYQPYRYFKGCGAVNYFCQHGYGLIFPASALTGFLA